jgi:hypothetical protein
MREQLERLRGLNVPELRLKYRELFGEESRWPNRHFLYRRVAWRLQALAEGDISERARRRALQIANVYKVDRLSRSLLDFARIIGIFDEHQVSFVSVTQQFNTHTSLGRLRLNVLLSFAHYAERVIMQSHSAEVTVWLALWS